MMENQATISAWCDATFGKASNARVATRANEEMAELLRAVTEDENHPKAIEEAADIVIILFRLADRMGKNLMTEVDRKMAINRARQWQTTADGHGYHVREAV